MSLFPETLYKESATIIGLGAIGRQVALQLTSIGVGNLILIDHDTVELHNLPNQGYREDDIGEQKVRATLDECFRLNTEVRVVGIPEKFSLGLYERHDQLNWGTIFCCVDSIDVRKMIWEVLKDRPVFIDGRMSAESMRIITAYKGFDYGTTLFESTEAFAGSCTAKSTIYCANIAAGMMVSQYTKVLRGFNTENDLCVNLLGNVLEIL
jgi:sulfur carrier protein ThiS adenylyltransferase